MEGDVGVTGGHRARIHQALVAADAFLGARDVHRRLEETGAPAGLATVYRHLHALVDDGRVETVRTLNGELFRAAHPAASAHLHLVCGTCGAADEVGAIEHGAADEQIRAASRARGFVVERHTIEVVGTCATCA